MTSSVFVSRHYVSNKRLTFPVIMGQELFYRFFRRSLHFSGKEFQYLFHTNATIIQPPDDFVDYAKSDAVLIDQLSLRYFSFIANFCTNLSSQFIRSLQF